MRACRELGIGSVGVFSEPDRDALHLKFADETREIGGAKPAESYLNIERIISAAVDCGAEAIHPGYGFFAENAASVKHIEEAGLTFIGPASQQVALMGDKLRAREVATQVGLLLLSSTEALKDKDAVHSAAEQLGFPVVVKPVAGGGGIGTTIVSNPSELDGAYSLASRLGKQAFGNAMVYLERFLPDARHIEVQIIADRHGTTLDLGERECTLQRRFQKLVEEAPSAAVNEALRAEMAAAAIRLVQTIGYQSVGTVEFLLGPDGRFYFLEMNTRIQVEHAVTEMITGIDLVREQIRIAAGLPMSFRSSAVKASGHAIECRICSEDPKKSFMPSTGQISEFHLPGGPGVRVDSGVSAGSSVPIYYDSLLCKVICWDTAREHATVRMRRSLAEFRVDGVRTTRDLQLAIMESPEWQENRIYTRFIEQTLVPRFAASE